MEWGWEVSCSERFLASHRHMVLTCLGNDPPHLLRLPLAPLSPRKGGNRRGERQSLPVGIDQKGAPGWGACSVCYISEDERHGPEIGPYRAWSLDGRGSSQQAIPEPTVSVTTVYRPMMSLHVLRFWYSRPPR